MANNLAQRVLTAATLGVGVVFAIYYSSWGIWGFCLLATLLALVEYFRLIQFKTTAAEMLFACAAAVFFWFNLTPERAASPLLWAGLIAFPPLLAIRLLYRPDEKAAFYRIAMAVFGLVYLLAPFAFYYLLTFNGSGQTLYDWHIGLGILFLHWLADTAAYFGGRSFGRHKIFERVSPKKTWEGFIVAVIATLLLGWGFEMYWPTPKFNWIVAAGIAVVIGLYGDLVESLFKRNLHIKDSGSLLPGHGGILDRFDGFFLTLPLIYAYSLIHHWAFNG